MTKLANVATVLALLAASRCLADRPRALWFYYPTNLLVNENVDRLEHVFRRAARAGYTHVHITDSKFCRLGEMPQRYFDHVARVRALAEELRLELVPGVFPLGWSNDLLYHDPNLAEGLPVRDALFVVQSGEARLVPDPQVELPGGSFEDLSRWTWKDDTVTPDRGAALIRDPGGANARIVQRLRVSPFRQYHVSVRIKTENFQGTPEVKVLADGRVLNYNDLGVQPTQDWTEHRTVFNSLEHTEVSVYFGAWGATSGSLWFDSARIEEVGLLNVLRRPGAPLVVRLENGRLLQEGQDFEPVADPRLGNQPYNGVYEVWHEPPVLRTHLPDGTRLRVSYYHPMIIYGGSVMIALAEPRTQELLADMARRVHDTWQARSYFMMHDEIRILNWDAASLARGLDAGALLAENVRFCIHTLRSLDPAVQIYVWSDMFDPHHNAHADYYLVRGDLSGSWEGLDDRVVIVNWNHGGRDKSLPFFARRGHKQLIAAYYDAPLEQVQDWLSAAGNVPAVIGIMYTTWQNDYSQLETFARAVAAWRGSAR